MDEIYIDGNKIDYSGDAVAMEIKSNVFSDPDKISGSYTYSITVPLTLNNRRVFGGVSIFSDSKFLYQEHAAEIRRDGVPIVTGGRCVVSSLDDEKISFNIICGVVLSFEKLKNLRLSELEELPEDITTQSEIAAGNVAGCDVPLGIFYSEKKTEAGVPVIRVPRIFQLIERSTGVKIAFQEDGVLPYFGVILAKNEWPLHTLDRYRPAAFEPLIHNRAQAAGLYLDSQSNGYRRIRVGSYTAGVTNIFRADTFLKLKEDGDFRIWYKFRLTYINKAGTPYDPYIKFKIRGDESISEEEQIQNAAFPFDITEETLSDGRVRKTCYFAADLQQEGSKDDHFAFYLRTKYIEDYTISFEEPFTVLMKPKRPVNMETVTQTTTTTVIEGGGGWRAAHEVQIKTVTDRTDPFSLIANLPDMKCIDFVKNICLALGLFTAYDTAGGIVLKRLRRLHVTQPQAYFDTTGIKSVDLKHNFLARKMVFGMRYKDGDGDPAESVLELENVNLSESKDIKPEFTEPIMGDSIYVPYVKPAKKKKNTEYEDVETHLIFEGNRNLDGQAVADWVNYLDPDTLKWRYEPLVTFLERCKVIKATIFISPLQLLKLDLSMPIGLNGYRGAAFMIESIKTGKNNTAEITAVKF